jgi:hypothetical protein
MLILDKPNNPQYGAPRLFAGAFIVLLCSVIFLGGGLDLFDLYTSVPEPSPLQPSSNHCHGKISPRVLLVTNSLISSGLSLRILSLRPLCRCTGKIASPHDLFRSARSEARYSTLSTMIPSIRPLCRCTGKIAVLCPLCNRTGNPNNYQTAVAQKTCFARRDLRLTVQLCSQ